MEYSKLNVFHWHIVDGISFPFESETSPDLVKGAFHPELIYTHKDIRHLVRYAKERGITIIPEIDTPGHTSSWNIGYPGSSIESVNQIIDLVINFLLFSF